MTRDDFIQRRREIDESFAKRAKEAVEQERLTRDLSWIDGVLIPVAGKLVRHITAHDYLVMTYARNAFLTGTTIYPVDVFDFLWQLSPKYKYGSRWRKYWFSRGMKISLPRAIEEINSFLDDSMIDMPKGAGSSHGRRPEPVSFILALCHSIAVAYGLDPDVVKHKPLCRIFQMHHEIQINKLAATGKGYTHMTPSEGAIESERLIAITALNEEYVKSGGVL